MKITTNKLELNFNKEYIDRDFEFFRFNTSEKYFRYGARFIDQASDLFKAKSLCFNDGRDFSIMLCKDPDNWNHIRTALRRSDNDTITVQQVKSSEISDRNLFQLFLNSLATYDTERLSFSNLTGRLYCYKPNFTETIMITMPNGTEKEIAVKIHAFEVSFTEDLLLSVQIRTFTSSLLKKSIEFGKKKWEDYPKYVQTDKNTLKRSYSNTEDDVRYIMRQTKGCKFGSAKFLSLYSESDFCESKAGIIEYITGELRRKYSAYLSFEFESFETEANIACRPLIPEKRAQVLKKVLESMDVSVKLIDRVQTVQSENVIEEIRSILLDKYSVKSIVGKRYSDGFLNIQLIHEAAFYKSQLPQPIQ